MIKKTHGAITELAHQMNTVSRNNTISGMRKIAEFEEKVYDVEHEKTVETMER